MEAKSNNERLASLPIRRPDQDGFGLKATQLQGLAEAGKLAALVAVVWRNGPERLLFPFEVLANAWYDFRLGKFNRIPVVAAIPYTRGKIGGINGELWLEALLAHENAAR